MAFWNLFFSSLLIPLVAVALLWRRPRRPATSWLVTLFMAAGLTGFSFFVAPWGVFGLPVRWTVAALFGAAVATSLIRTPPADGPDDSPMRLVVKLLIGFFFGGVAAGVLSGRKIPAPPRDLAFPLRGGAFLVMHGGSTAAANAHHPDEKQRYAIDLVKLRRFGMRAAGVFPADPRAYAIFGAPVFSPCHGSVLRTFDGRPDGGEPAVTPAPDPLGNHVVLRCEDIDVTLAHLQQGSVAVRPGSPVARGAPLARAGHSGASPEPHLHVHAERDGKAVPVTFDGRWLVRNGVVHR